MKNDFSTCRAALFDKQCRSCRHNRCLAFALLCDVCPNYDHEGENEKFCKCIQAPKKDETTCQYYERRKQCPLNQQTRKRK